MNEWIIHTLTFCSILLSWGVNRLSPNFTTLCIARNWLHTHKKQILVIIKRVLVKSQHTIQFVVTLFFLLLKIGAGIVGFKLFTLPERKHFENLFFVLICLFSFYLFFLFSDALKRFAYSHWYGKHPLSESSTVESEGVCESEKT